MICQPTIYDDNVSLITGFWTGSLSVSEVSTDSPFEGSMHYMISYNSGGYWAGLGMNLNNWGNNPSYDFGTYNAVRIAYRGLSDDHRLNIRLRNPDGTYSNEVTVGGAILDYKVIEIPFLAFYAGRISDFDFSDISEVALSITSGEDPYSGTVFVDKIELFNMLIPSPSSLENWVHFSQMGKGVNLSNWLDAYWDIPFGSYPNPNRYTRERIQSLVDLGFESIRMPVTFERIADPDPPYSISNDHPTWALIDSLILFAEEMDFSLIIDNHHGYDFTDANAADEIPRKVSIWNQVMQRYASLECDRYFFELYNEPRGVSNAQLRILMDSIISTLRSYNTCHSLIIGANGFNSSGGLVATIPYDDPSIIYTYHSYDPYFFTHQGMNWTDPPNFPALSFPVGNDSINLVKIIKSVQDWMEFYGQPAMLGEFGVANSADAQSRCNYITTVGNELKKLGMPWYYWDVFSITNGFGFTDGSTMPTCFSEALRIGEDNTCQLKVSTVKNSGIGSMRDAIKCAKPGDTIIFDIGLPLDTIRLEDFPLVTDKLLVIKNTIGSPIVLTADDSSAFLLNGENGEIAVDGIDFLDIPFPALVNFGTIYFDNVKIKYSNGNLLLNSGGKYVFRQNVEVVE